MKISYEYAGETYELDLSEHQEGYRAVLNGEIFDFQVINRSPGMVTLQFGSRVRTFYWAAEQQTRWVAHRGCTYLLQRPTAKQARRAQTRSRDAALRAPMPAQVRSVFVKNGDEVAMGETLLLLEAMKMEIKVQSPRAGRIQAVRVASGETVLRDQILLELEEA
jgi:biotin carboxyl carrier protein